MVRLLLGCPCWERVAKCAAETFGAEQWRIVGVAFLGGKYAGGGVAVAARDMLGWYKLGYRLEGVGWRRSAVAGMAMIRVVTVFFAPKIKGQCRA